MDELTISMQNEAIVVASERLGYPLSQELVNKIRNPRWSYMGLEMIIDTVRTIHMSEIEKYISSLE